MARKDDIRAFRHAMRLLPALFRNTSGVEDAVKLKVLRVLNSIYVLSTVADDIERLMLVPSNVAECEFLEDFIEAEKSTWSDIVEGVTEGITDGVLGGVTSGVTVSIPSYLEKPTMTRVDASPIEAAINANTFAISDPPPATRHDVDSEFFGTEAATRFEESNLDLLKFSDPLWRHAENALSLSALKEPTDQMLNLANDPTFRFWSNWYKGFISGKPLDGSLLFDVAFVDDTTWEAGPEAVAAEIERIQARLALQDEIAELRDEVLKLRQNQATPATGHNQGPPIDDSEIHLRESFDLVWPILDELEEEAAQHSPDISRLKALALRLWEVAKTAAIYCGAKLDTALDKAAETVGETGTKWAIRSVVATYASTNEGVQSVAKLAWKFAKTLSGS